jgi:hypothetical protein
MIIVHSLKSGKFYIIEFIGGDDFIFSSINEGFALTSKLKRIPYTGEIIFRDFRRFVLENKPA